MMPWHIVTLILIILCCSCSLLKKKGTWGKNALWPIRGERVSTAFKKNVTSPHVWLPLAGAGIFYWGGYDDKTAQWIEEEKTVYNKTTHAQNWSDNFNNVLRYEMYLTALLTPSMDKEGSLKNYALNKARGGLVVAIASGVPDNVHDTMTRSIKRQRPNKGDYRSFPSGHALSAGSRNIISSRNLDAIEMKSGVRTGIKAVNTTMAVGVMWGRIEGQSHHPSDVLAAYAIGAFVSGFIYDSLINYEANESFVFVPEREKITAIYSILF